MKNRFINKSVIVFLSIFASNFASNVFGEEALKETDSAKETQSLMLNAAEAEHKNAPNSNSAFIGGSPVIFRDGIWAYYSTDAKPQIITLQEHDTFLKIQKYINGHIGAQKDTYLPHEAVRLLIAKISTSGISKFLLTLEAVLSTLKSIKDHEYAMHGRPQCSDNKYFLEKYGFTYDQLEEYYLDWTNAVRVAAFLTQQGEDSQDVEPLSPLDRWNKIKAGDAENKGIMDEFCFRFHTGQS